jgi:hypothetical protein
MDTISQRVMYVYGNGHGAVGIYVSDFAESDPRRAVFFAKIASM